MRQPTSGIYSIYFDDIDNKYYIGCSTRIYLREKEHINLLKANKHPNYLLQEAFNISKFSPTFTILELVEDIGFLFSKEIEWILRFDSYNNGFNLTKGGALVGVGAGCPAAKYSKEVYVSVLNTLAYTSLSSSEIAKKLNVSISVVKGMRCLGAHVYLKPEYPKEYALLEKKYEDFCSDRQEIREPVNIKNRITGQIYQVTNRRQAALELNLDTSRFNKLMNRRITDYRGWDIVHES